MAHITPQEQEKHHRWLIASRKAGSPLIVERTFTAKDHPKGSDERHRLNQDIATSEHKSSKPWAVKCSGRATELFTRRTLAEQALFNIVKPYLPARDLVPLPFDGAFHRSQVTRTS